MTAAKQQANAPVADQTHFDAIAGHYYGVVDRLPFDLGYFHQEELQVIAQKFAATRQQRILDAGCGPGRHTVALARLGHLVTAVDFSEQMLAETQRALAAADLVESTRLLQADVRALPLDNESFDAIVCMEVLEHLPGGVDDIHLALTEFARLLRPGGMLIVEAPQPRYLELVTSHDDFLPGWNRVQSAALEVYEQAPLKTQNQLAPELIESLLREHNFGLEAVRYVRVLPSGLIERYPILERFDRILEQHPDTAREAREAIWIARRCDDASADNHPATATRVLAGLHDPLRHTLNSLQQALALERSELLSVRSQLAAAEQQARRVLEKSLSAKDTEIHGLQARITSLGKQLSTAEQRREGLRAALAREQQARRLLEHSVTAGYQQTLTRVSEVVAAVTPRRSTVLIASKGDESLLKLKARTAWHFPRTDAGEYAGHHPADSGEAIAHLELLRDQGGQYLLLPNTMYWWLDHYREFREHLDARYARVWDDERFIIFDLSGTATNGKSAAWPRRISQWFGKLRTHSGGRPTVHRHTLAAIPPSSGAPAMAADAAGSAVPRGQPPNDSALLAPPCVAEHAEAAGQAVLFAAVPYDDIGGGQRPAQLARALLRRHWQVTYIYIYARTDMTTGAPLESDVAIPRLDHRHIDDITPEELLAIIRDDTPLVFEVPHPQFLPFAELAWKRGLRTVFELIDDWETSLGGGWFDRDVLEQFVRRSATCVGTARVLVEKLRGMGAPQAQYAPNAADESVFDAYHKYSRPRDWPHSYERVLLYFGSMYGEWFGWDYLQAAAERNPRSAFVMIGDPPRTHALPANVIFLGPKENHQLPAYLAHADAALIPFLPGPITDAVSPIKVFEYLFLKKPVIATRMPELDAYPSVYQAASPQEFAELCRTVATNPASPDRDRELDLFVSRNSWNARLDQLLATKAPRRQFSLIILIHNNRHVIGRCLTTLLEHSRGLGAELIVVDNASTDGGGELVERDFPQVKLIRNAKNGCSSGRNLGAAAASGDYLVFIDSDQWFTSSTWLREADDILSRHPAIGAVGWFAGWFDAGLDSLAGPTVDLLPCRGDNAESQQRGFRTDVAYLGTGGLFVPRCVYEACGGFDPDFDPHTFEDTDFSFQVRKAGFRLAYRNLGGIRHQPHQTSRSAAQANDYQELFERNSAHFKHKWADYLELFTRGTVYEASDDGACGLSPRERLSAELHRISQSAELPIVYTTPIDWNIPMFQRPQQMALALGELGHPTLYMTPNRTDGVRGIQKVSRNCWLVPFAELATCCGVLERFALVVVSTSSLNCTMTNLDATADRAIVVYDYIDDLNDDIHPISDEMRKAHRFFLKNADLVCATADRLREQALSMAAGSVMACPNGADVAHFRLTQRPPVPAELAPLVQSRQPIVGYFGALAKWFDYQLIRRIAAERPAWQIVLIGVDYDESLSASGITRLPNVHYLGTRPYDLLPHYAAWFDVAIVPFLINDVTQSTSPIKLFEYMAARKPIVATDLRECRKYMPVLIAKTHEEFIAQLDLALQRRTDANYLALLDRHADENSWLGRARDLVAEINKLAETRKWQ